MCDEHMALYGIDISHKAVEEKETLPSGGIAVL